MKKSLLLVVSLVFVLVLSFTCFAEYYGNPIDSGACGKDGDNVIWTMYDSGTLVISGQGEMEDFGNWAGSFSDAEYIKYFAEQIYSRKSPVCHKVVVEDGVTSIGNSAFLDTVYSNDFYLDISLPDSITRIGNLAFFGSYNFVNKNFIPDSVISIGDSIFSEELYTSTVDGVNYYGNLAVSCSTSVPYVSIKEGTKAISPTLFFDWNGNDILRNVYIPNSVQEFEGNPFRACTNVTVTIAKDNPYMCVDNYGVIYNADMTKILAVPSGSYLGGYVIPDSVKEICSGAFYGCKYLYSINLGKNIEKIGGSAFYNCDSLSYVTIPGNIKIINGGMFGDCDNLTKVDVLYGVETIDVGAFDSCDKLSEVNLPNSLKSLGSSCFGDLKSMKTIDIPSTVVGFIGTNGTDVSLPVFYGSNSLETVYLSGDDIRYFNYHHSGMVEYPNMKTIYFKDATDIKNAIKLIWDFFPSTTQFLPLYVGSKINSYLNTDIVARIDGKPIRSYNIDGYTVIIAEDLKNYGFNVNFDNEKRILYVDDIKGEITSTYTDSAFRGRVGDVAGDVLYTDIDTYVNGLPVKSYNIGGYTAIYISDLECFGAVVWNETERTISFMRN